MKNLRKQRSETLTEQEILREKMKNYDELNADQLYELIKISKCVSTFAKITFELSKFNTIYYFAIDTFGEYYYDHLTESKFKVEFFKHSLDKYNQYQKSKAKELFNSLIKIN